MTNHEITLAVEAARREARVYCSRNRNLDGEEVTGEAMVITAEVLPKYDGRGTRQGWVASCVKLRLLALGRSAVWRRRVARATQTEIPDCETRPTFVTEQLLRNLSTDAAGVVRLALKLGTKYATIRALRRAGWHKCSIQAVFDEVKEALA